MVDAFKEGFANKGIQGDDPLPYEANLERLRQLVLQLEEGSLGLEESLRVFEEGMALSSLCDSQLRMVEDKVKVLVSGAFLENSGGSMAMKKDLELEMIEVEGEGKR